MVNTENSARMYLETRIVRSNETVFHARPPEDGDGRPSGYTCWGPESGSCRTMHISPQNAERCTDSVRRKGERERRERDFSDRRPVALYLERSERGRAAR